MLQFNDLLFFLILAAAWVVLRISRAAFVGRPSFARELVVNLLFFYLCYVIALTFFPFTYIFYSYSRDANFIPIVKTISMIRNAVMLGAMVNQVIINLAGNLFLLAPLGFLLPVVFEKTRTFWKVAGVCLAVTLSIELAQLSLAVRVFDVDDIILNTLGALLGYAVFKLVFMIPAAAALANRISRAARQGAAKAVLGFGLAALLIFLSIFTAQVFAQTVTIAKVSQEAAASGRQLLGETSFDGFTSLFSQTNAGVKSVDIYLQVFLNRYTLYSTQDGLQDLKEGTYSISAASKGSKQDYFIVARSRLAVYQMVYHGQPYPVVTFGEYHFSYASESMASLISRDHFDPFIFQDSTGATLSISAAN